MGPPNPALQNKIREHIEVHPGLRKTDLARRLDIVMGQLAHHLHMLEKARMIIVYETEPNHPRLFSTTRVRKGEKNIIASLRDNTESLIIKTLMVKSPLTHHELCRPPGLRRRPVLISLNKLVARGVIVEREVADGRRSLYSIADPGLVQMLLSELKDSLESSLNSRKNHRDHESPSEEPSEV